MLVGRMYLDVGSYLEALESYNTALEHDSSNQDALYGKGIGDIQRMSRSLAFSSSLPIPAAIFYRFSHLIDVENYDGELDYMKYFRRAMRLQPETAHNWENRGEYHKKDWAVAV